MQPGLIEPDWPLPAGVRSACTTRAGGVSIGPYASLNLGDHVGDAAEAVATNRNRLAGAMQTRPVFLRQVHGSAIASLDAATPDGTEADGCFSTQAGVACTIMVADCLPVLFAAIDGRAVAAAHAGWRGLAGEGGQGILESACRALERGTGILPAQLMAWLGPCIGPSAFEVGGDVKAAFERGDPGVAVHFAPLGGGKWLADLPGLARRRLKALGIRRLYGNDGSLEWCTVAHPSRFFSHRRDRVSGRFAACIWLA